ncbi:hypothetical protein [Rubidibacter lacunae]|uniref:hypothetical protein n=1 Tax=Rubidibacter lacunae TaxID=582514 RepID=UPI0004081EAA|nr:hypothetical protein [Rubidibacter lacunae]
MLGGNRLQAAHLGWPSGSGGCIVGLFVAIAPVDPASVNATGIVINNRAAPRKQY